MKQIEFEVNGVTAACELYENEVPDTCKAIMDLLPLEIGLHYAKFAGQEVFGIIPLLLPLEKYTLVSSLKTGSVAYYPDRQLFCIYYGQVQEEEAGVTVIGQLIANEEFIKELETVRDNQGTKIIIREPECRKKATITYKHIIRLDEDIWDKPPKEITDLMKRRGYTQPIGPILYGEGGLRDLIGILWRVRELYEKTSKIDMQFFRCVTDYFCQIIGGWCGLKRVAGAIQEYSDLLENSDTGKMEILEDMILFTGRVHMWIDLLIPWEKFNESICDYKK